MSPFPFARRADVRYYKTAAQLVAHVLSAFRSNKAVLNNPETALIMYGSAHSLAITFVYMYFGAGDNELILDRSI